MCSLLSLVSGGWPGASTLGILTSFCCALLTSAFLFPLDTKYSALYCKQSIKQAIPSPASNKKELGLGSPFVMLRSQRGCR